MMNLKRWLSICVVAVALLGARPARADFWGGDLPLLAEIVVNTAQQLIQLKEILSKGSDSLDYLHEVNDGVRTALGIIHTMNTTLHPGMWGDLGNVDQVLSMIEQIYGRIPRTQNAPLEQAMDQSVAESINLHNEAFKYADRVDPEAERIKDHAQTVSPMGAGRLTAESMGVLITVMNQVLRTNAALLKIQSEQLALMNRREKLNSEQFKTQYDGLGKAFGELKPEYQLPSVQ